MSSSAEEAQGNGVGKAYGQLTAYEIGEQYNRMVKIGFPAIYRRKTTNISPIQLATRLIAKSYLSAAVV